MRNHEYYFESLEGGAKSLGEASPLKKAIQEQFGSWEEWLTMFKAVALTRGIGWAVLYFDPKVKMLVHAWVDEQHLGQLNGCQFIFGIDMWEHSFVADYQPSGKKQYVEDFLSNVNWEVIEKNYLEASK
jgi:Fe-Mn family superoxide dismutase